MSIEEIIYNVLSESEDLKSIFGDNIHPLTSKKQKLPALMYTIFLTDVNHSKNSKSIMDIYTLRLHIFSEDYKEVIDAVDIIKELLDYKELVDDDNNILIDLIRFISYTDEYEEKPELFNRSIDFSIHKVN
ncbi:hypothetical protein [Belliella pelovolcani]|uniref:DUF3168 domain-containing protein n=1 Tax=Belliella pelovolcani TaxID=529505 RepID=A0A1N7MR22_9BACT|nr:hypothetical protein [Belliella pelovolcani]SIS88576.1 hypothetical protein SAMN05421761_10758 [Belliella pelovolcani]